MLAACAKSALRTGERDSRTIEEEAMFKILLDISTSAPSNWFQIITLLLAILILICVFPWGRFHS